jgi:HAD superfamily hydrolase (TIGR01484 family)
MNTSGFKTQKQFVLATDLDGTFLGGDEEARLALYRWIDDHRDDVELIFVSGRDLPFIQKLCTTTPVPWPDFVIGDVGTTIAQVHDDIDDNDMRVRPLPPLESEIAALWNDSGAKVRDALQGASGLTPQETPFRYRMSYHYDPKTFHPDALETVQQMGFDALISDDRFFDVLPKGISKGPSLLRLIDWLEHDADAVLVAGDTMNDLSLFETDLKGVAVGNSEPALISRLGGRNNVHHARGHGCAGIAEAIEALKMHSVNGGT